MVERYFDVNQSSRKIDELNFVSPAAAPWSTRPCEELATIRPVLSCSIISIGARVPWYSKTGTDILRRLVDQITRIKQPRPSGGDSSSGCLCMGLFHHSGRLCSYLRPQ